MPALCWETILHGSRISAHFRSRGTECLFSGTFQGRLDVEIVCSSRAKDSMPLAHHKRSRAPNPRLPLLYCNPLPGTYQLVLFTLPCCNWSSGNWSKKLLGLWLLILLQIMKSFVSDPRVSCLLPESMKQKINCDTATKVQYEILCISYTLSSTGVY